MVSVGVLVNTSWNIINFRLNLINYLMNQGYRVVVFIPDQEHKDTIESTGAEVIMIKKLSRKGTNPLNDFLLYKEYTRQLEEAKVDLVLGFTIKPNIYGAMACKKLSIPFLPTITGLGSAFIHQTITTRVARQLYKMAFRGLPAVFFQNPDDKEVFVQSKLVDSQQGNIIPGSGIDTQLFKKETNPTIQTTSFQYLFVGRLLRDKGVYELLEASQQLHNRGIDFVMHIVGDIDTNNPTSLTQEELTIWQSKPFLTFHGYKSDVKNMMANAHCVILPSYREGLPRVILEAMSMSLPVITNDVPGCRSLVTHGENGWLCQVKNVDDLYQKMHSMVALSEEQRNEMGEKGRQRCVQKHDVHIINDLYRQYIEKYIQK